MINIIWKFIIFTCTKEYIVLKLKHLVWFSISITILVIIASFTLTIS